MRRPLECIRYSAKPGRTPTRAEAQMSRLFSPVGIGPLILKQRTWVPAMAPWRASEEGFLTDDVICWHDRFARGRPGAIVVEATGIKDVPSGPLLRIGHDRDIAGLRRLVDTVRKASGGETRLLIQLIDFLSIRRRPDPRKFFERFLAVTDAHGAQRLATVNINATTIASPHQQNACRTAPTRSGAGPARSRRRHGPP
jgi:2,4-dienoyl-CoA reductase-like NADH-dependent reductase (Old Yellow Enzyme family)